MPKLAESKCRGLHYPVIATSHTKEFTPNNLHIYYKEPHSSKYNPFLRVKAGQQYNLIKDVCSASVSMATVMRHQKNVDEAN